MNSLKKTAEALFVFKGMDCSPKLFERFCTLGLEVLAMPQLFAFLSKLHYLVVNNDSVNNGWVSKFPRIDRYWPLEEIIKSSKLKLDNPIFVQ